MKPRPFFDHAKVFAYLQAHKEVTDVLISGGEPFAMRHNGLRTVLDSLQFIEHVRTVRIGTRMPVWDPGLITKDTIDLLRPVTHDRMLFVVVHFANVREVGPSLGALKALRASGAKLLAQIPLLRGINDGEGELSALLRELVAARVQPYYVFQCRPTKGNGAFRLSLEDAFDVYQRETALLSGPARVARLVMSDGSGKWEIVGIEGGYALLKKHRVPGGKAGRGLLRVDAQQTWI